MSSPLRAVFLLGTLKKKQTLSNTQALCEVVAEVLLKQEGVRSEIVRLRDYDIQPGTKTEIDGDDWPRIVKKMLRAEIVIFATPIWWGIQSSLLQSSADRNTEDLAQCHSRRMISAHTVHSTSQRKAPLVRSRPRSRRLEAKIQAVAPSRAVSGVSSV